MYYNVQKSSHNTEEKEQMEDTQNRQRAVLVAADTGEWDPDESMAELSRQYARIADLSERHFDDTRPLLYLNFLSKIAAYLNDRPCLECKLVPASNASSACGSPRSRRMEKSTRAISSLTIRTSAWAT